MEADSQEIVIPQSPQADIIMVGGNRQEPQVNTDRFACRGYSLLVHWPFEAVTEAAGPPGDIMTSGHQKSGQCCVATFLFGVSGEWVKRIYQPNNHIWVIYLNLSVSARTYFVDTDGRFLRKELYDRLRQ